MGGGHCAWWPVLRDAAFGRSSGRGDALGICRPHAEEGAQAPIYFLMVRSAAKPRVSNHGRRALLLVARPSRRDLRPLLRTRSVDVGEIRSFNLTRHHRPVGPAKDAVSRPRL